LLGNTAAATHKYKIKARPLKKPCSTISR